jgi:hypothetical protein
VPTPKELLQLWDLLGLVHLKYLDDLGSVEQVSFEYALMLGSLTTETYLKLMEWQAQIWHNYG